MSIFTPANNDHLIGCIGRYAYNTPLYYHITKQLDWKEKINISQLPGKILLFLYIFLTNRGGKSSRFVV